MRLDDYDERDGKKAWLEQNELDALIGKAKKPEEKVTTMLGGKCWLRWKEIADVTLTDFVETYEDVGRTRSQQERNPSRGIRTQ